MAWLPHGRAGELRMGREAECTCAWGPQAVPVRALLESDQLILTGGIRRKVPFSEIQRVHALEGTLVFSLQGEQIRLTLGEAVASTWCRIITSPPVTLAKKLGITPDSFVWQLGETCIAELEAALAIAKQVQADRSYAQAAKLNLIVASIDSPKSLVDTLQRTATLVERGVPMWILYPKGKGHAVNEHMVLSVARESGLVDTKVAAISATHTGLRFTRRR